MKTLLFLLAAVVTAWASHGGLWTLPDRHNPWAPLAYEDPPNWVTRHKLARLAEQPQACRAMLSATKWEFSPVPDRETGAGCAIRDGVHIRRTSLMVGPSFTLTCPAAASLALWERHVLQPQAQVLLGSAVRRVEHFGSYACRNVYGREEGQRSQHATANAFDVAGFVLEDGRRISVARDWSDTGPAAAFLHAIHRGACPLFNGVLGPKYNGAHADHFHLDRGPYRICR